MYNCKDEHLASVSVGGDLIVHNLASGARATELKDPNGQVLRLLDYSRSSRHLLVTAGDDGTVHLWDTTGRSPKMSWLKQHSAPTAGVCFSPSNEKVSESLSLLLQIRKKVRKKWLQLILQTMCMSPSILISLSNALDIEFINIVST
jgi:WD40 repeat protein